MDWLGWAIVAGGIAVVLSVAILYLSSRGH